VALATTKGFSIFAIYPQFKPQIIRAIEGGIQQLQMVKTSNIVILVPTGQNSEYPKEQVIVWDDKLQLLVFKVDFHEEIRALNYSNNLYFVVKTEAVMCMKLNNKPLKEIETCSNKRGLNAVAHECDNGKSGETRFCIATPSTTSG
jgi:hypothetical protein